MIVYDRKHVKLIVIHHLGDGLGPATSEAELRRRATPPGDGAPAYDFGVLSDGRVIALRSLEYQGAHAISNRPKYMYGEQYWNRNAAGIVMATDNTLSAPPEAMIQGLINHLVYFANMQGFGIGGMYPHFQICTTACPGGSYHKLGLKTGKFDYDRVEQAVNARCIIKGVL